MTAITFDTLKYANRLKDAGVPDKQAEAMSVAQLDVLSESMTTTLATKSDIAEVKMELAVLKWMMGIQLGGTIAIILKSFFPS
ncbi:MAG: DUF1640 domain-containing protein [Magnetococcales bacterium]|nr:DUF1640 domain-containing protein [Magnetococcales bacterium]